MLSKEDLSNRYEYPAYSAESTNNGIIGYTNYPEFICDKEHPIYITFGDHTRTFNIANKSFSVLDNVKVLLPIISSYRSLLWIITAWQKKIPNLGYARHWKIAKECTIQLPIKCGQIDFEFMENFVAELESRRVAELESRRVAELESYLLATGLKDYVLTAEEEKALNDFNSLEWEEFNLEKLFGKATRGKRLKSDDRIKGVLPFVTAGEADEGISAFIGNKVEVFESNTTTIDMFGSAKYRNYKYGDDDHVAVVHTESLPIKSAIFVTSAIHKAAHTGEFNYGHNFYAKDADNLNVMLPAKGDVPDYKFMENYVSAIQKLVIKDVVLYADSKIEATKTIIDKD